MRALSNVVLVFVVAVLRLGSTQTGPSTQLPTTERAPLKFIFCPPNMTEPLQWNKDTTRQLTWPGPVVNHEEYADAVTSSHYPPVSFEFTGAPEVVTYTVTDGEQVDICSFTVTVLDNQHPTFANCPNNPNIIVKEINLQSSTNGARVEFDVEVQENTGRNNLVISTSPLDSGDEFPYGPTQVTVNATDRSGNSALCVFSVIVRVPLEDSCESDDAGRCSSLLTVREYTENSVTLYWPRDADPGASGEYIISYWPEEEPSNRKNRTQSFYGWNTFGYTYTQGQLVDGLSSGTPYLFEIRRGYSDGTTALVGSLFQRTKPSVPSDITVNKIKTTTASVSWTIDTEQDNVDQYHVFYVDRSLTAIDAGYFPKTTESALLTNLQPDPNYQIAVTVEAIVGSGKYEATNSHSVTFVTEAVENGYIEVKNSTENSLAVVWHGAARDDGQPNEPYLLYLFNEKKEQIGFQLVLPDYSTGLYSPEFDFTELEPLTTYSVTVVYNGQSAFRTSLEHKTRPKRVEDLKASVVGDNSFTLIWDRARSAYPDRYEILISPHDNTSVSLPVKVTDTEFEFLGLNTLTEYYVTVVAVDQGMKSVPVSTMITTGIPVPKPPSSSVDLGLPITIGAIMGVFIIFLIIIIFFLLCLIPCSTKPLPAQVGDGVNPDKKHGDYAYADNFLESGSRSALTPSRSAPFPPRPPKKDSTADLLQMEVVDNSIAETELEANGGPPEQEPYINMVIVNNVPEQRNVFGLTLPAPGRKSLFRRKGVDRPVTSEIPGKFQKTDDPQIYDDVPIDENQV